MSPIQAITTCLRKSFQFSGRATRSEFWWFLPLPVLTVAATIGVVDRFNGLANDAFLFSMLFILFPSLSFVMIAAGTRRLVDAGSSFSRLFQVGFLVVLTAYFGCGALAITMKLLFGASDESLMALGFVAVFICLPVALLLLLCFAAPLAAPSSPGPNRYGPNPLEVTP